MYIYVASTPGSATGQLALLTAFVFHVVCRQFVALTTQAVHKVYGTLKIKGATVRGVCCTVASVGGL